MIQKLKGDHQQLADLEMSRHLQALEKSSAISPKKSQKGHRLTWAIGFILISQEMRHGLKIRQKKPHFSQFGQVILATPTAVKVIGVIPWIHRTESRRQQLPVMRTPGKQLGTPKTSSRSSSKDNSPHPRRTLSLALVTLEAE